jgi:hypothetical protein
MNMHPIIHSGLVRERQRDLERAMQARRLSMLARAADPAASEGMDVRQVVPCDDVVPARLALESASVRGVPC